MSKKKTKMPDSSDAEKWIVQDTFTYEGGIYRLNPDFTISKVG